MQTHRIIALGLAAASAVAVVHGRKTPPVAPAAPPLTLSVRSITMANKAAVKMDGQRYACKLKTGCTFTTARGTTIVFLPKL